MGTHVVGFATSPMQSGGQNQKWAHMWAVCLHPRCCLGGPQRFEAGDKIRIGPTCGRFGYITRVVSGVPNAPSGGQNQKWAHMRLQAGDKIRNGPTCGELWLHHPCCLGGSHCFRVGGQPHKMARMRANRLHEPLLSRGSPTVQSGGQLHKWAHMWADWLHHPYCLGGPQRFKAGDKIRNGPTCGQIDCITLAVSESPLL